jgi:hypothetical protein
MLTPEDTWLNICDYEGKSKKNFPKGLNPIKHMLFKNGESIDGIGVSVLAHSSPSIRADFGRGVSSF